MEESAKHQQASYWALHWTFPPPSSPTHGTCASGSHHCDCIVKRGGKRWPNVADVCVCGRGQDSWTLTPPLSLPKYNAVGTGGGAMDKPSVMTRGGGIPSCMLQDPGGGTGLEFSIVKTQSKFLSSWGPPGTPQLEKICSVALRWAIYLRPPDKPGRDTGKDGHALILPGWMTQSGSRKKWPFKWWEIGRPLNRVVFEGIDQRWAPTIDPPRLSSCRRGGARQSSLRVSRNSSI